MGAKDLDWKDLNSLCRDLKSRVQQLEQLTRARPGQANGVLQTLGEVQRGLVAMEQEHRSRSRALATLTRRLNLVTEDEAFARRLAVVTEGHEGRLVVIEREQARLRGIGDAIEQASAQDVDLVASCLGYLARAGRGRPAPVVVREVPPPVGVA